MNRYRIPRLHLVLSGCFLFASTQLLSAQENEWQKDKPRPTPVTRPEMKQLLEKMKERPERFVLPPLTQEEKTNPDPRAQSYEGRLSQLYLPATGGARSYLQFSGSSPRTAQSTQPNRPVLEEDPSVTLSYGFKTRLFWIASRANNCQYCLGHQESKLLAVGMSEDQIASLDSDWDAFSREEQVAFAFARRLTLEPHLLSDKDIDLCREHYNERQILEMALSVGGNNAINRWKEGAGIPQSTSGGNFGGPNRSEGDSKAHSYLTDTSLAFAKKKSMIIPSVTAVGDVPIVPTKLIREDSLSMQEIERGLAKCASRTNRIPTVTEDRAREVLGDLAPEGRIPEWMKLLAHFPIAGKRQVNGFVSLENQLELSPLLRAQLSWVIARQNGAWYSLAESQRRLTQLGQTPEQIAQLISLDDTIPGDRAKENSSLRPDDRALLIVAKNLASSPVVLTDNQVAEGIRLNSNRDVVQTIHYTAMRSLFDRFTEAAGLRSEP